MFNGEPDIEPDGTIVRPALLTGGNLRRYQVEGLNWLKVNINNNVISIRYFSIVLERFWYELNWVKACFV